MALAPVLDLITSLQGDFALTTGRTPTHGVKEREPGPPFSHLLFFLFLTLKVSLSVLGRTPES